ncbi:hypothetical protein HW450_10115 [Corynebacterium hindlerae]|uniref:Uncharacterized protein n=2 Tax=Corynebacterium hindlerae TaxID=699041 RepID=A0A7G5FDK1_9CORY|nr:hypothetical protein [Corynebacterium hindlerae]QMV84692.1 hypothetical protein HW450_10115 [Corynebacterium hindlerae]
MTDEALFDTDFDGYADLKGFETDNDQFYDDYKEVTSDLAPTIDIDMDAQPDAGDYA